MTCGGGLSDAEPALVRPAGHPFPAPPRTPIRGPDATSLTQRREAPAFARAARVRLGWLVPESVCPLRAQADRRGPVNHALTILPTG